MSTHDDPGPGWKLRFWSIFTGQALSLIGSAMTQFVLLWWIADTTDSISALATAGMAALLPQALLAPIGGVFADRYSRRLLMVAADGISAMCMVVLIVLFLTGRIELWHAYVMMAVRGAMQAFQSPAASASTTMLVPKDFLSRAAGLNQILVGLMTVAAAPLGALAISLMPLGLALTIDVVTALLSIVPLLVFRIPQPRGPRVEEHGMWSELRSGARVVWGDPGLRALYALIGIVTLVIMPSFTLVPLLVKDHFGGGVGDVALMEGAAGAAMILGGVAVAALAPRRHIRWILLGLAASCFALAMAAAMPSDLFWVAVMWWAACGAAFVIGDAPMMALLQSSIPPHQQGRVLSLLTMVMALAAPLGLALASPVGELVGIRELFILQGALAGCLCLLGFRSSALRKLSRFYEGPRTIS